MTVSDKTHYRALRKVRFLERKVRLLEDALRSIAASYDCETDGCSADNPMCVGATAAAAVQEANSHIRKYDPTEEPFA